MKPIIYVRELSEEEKSELEKGLRASDGFVLRRSQILITSSKGKSVPEIAEMVGCHQDTVREVVNGFNIRGLKALQKGSKRPHTIHRAFTKETEEKLKAILHQKPREYGKDSSLWSLELLAQVCFEQELTTKQVSGETIRTTLRRLGIRWKRAKHWITSPDPLYAHKKSAKKT